MAEKNEVYKCNACGNIIEVVHGGAGELVCCGAPMELLKEKTEDEGQEKHVPVVEKTANGFIVRVGSIAHPMEETHFIEWIEIIADNVSYKKFLKPGDAAEAEFCVKADKVEAREHCNVHGMWKA